MEGDDEDQHADDKDELLRLCYQTTAEPLTRELLADPIDPSKWRGGIRHVFNSLFEHSNAHPWLGAPMEGPLGQDAVLLRIWDRIGGTFDAAGLEPEEVLHAGSLLLAHLGSMAAVAAYGSDGRLSRDEGLAQQAAGLVALNPAEYPYVTRSVATFQSHTEQDQFLGGLEIILDGIELRVARSAGKRQGSRPVRGSRDGRRYALVVTTSMSLGADDLRPRSGPPIHKLWRRRPARGRSCTPP